MQPGDTVRLLKASQDEVDGLDIPEGALGTILPLGRAYEYEKEDRRLVEWAIYVDDTPLPTEWRTSSELPEYLELVEGEDRVTS